MTNKEKEELFNQLMSDNKERILRICSFYLGSRADLSDLFQEIQIAIWKSFDRFEGKSSWNTYIYRIAVNLSLKMSKQKAQQLKEKSFIEPEDISEESSSEAMEKERKWQAMEAAIEKLKDSDRIIIGMLLEDLSYKEIGDIMGITINNVGVKINRAKERLSKMIKENG